MSEYFCGYWLFLYDFRIKGEQRTAYFIKIIKFNMLSDAICDEGVTGNGRSFRI